MKLRHIALVLLGLVAGSIAWSVLRPKPPTKVAVTKAERVPELRAIVKATGEIRAKEFVDIQAEVPGVITELPVHEGDTVAKGALLLKLDDLQLRADADARHREIKRVMSAMAEAGIDDFIFGVFTPGGGEAPAP